MASRAEELIQRYPWFRSRTIVTEDQSGGRFESASGEHGWVVDGVVFDGVDFSGLDLAGLMVFGSSFTECDFSRAKLKSNVNLGMWTANEFGVDERQTVYRRCRFARADLVSPRGHPTILGAARFEECTFSRARISGWRTHQAEFVGCHFEGPIRSCVFYGRDFGAAHDPQPWTRKRNEFINNDFRLANLEGCSFRGGIDLTLQCWPDDSDYIVIADAELARRRITAAVAAISDVPARAEAADALDIYLRDLKEDQTTLLIRRGELEADLPPEHAAQVLQAIDESARSG